LLRDWLDLFNHRFTSLFFRAWEKYRFYIPYERGQYQDASPDVFTRAVFSFIGMGTPALHGRLRLGVREQEQERTLARVDDLALLYYSGLLAHRPRNAVGLEALLRDYFQRPLTVRQFLGQWLRLEPDSQSRMAKANNQLGVNLVAGERVWDVQSKFRVRIGPLSYADFVELLPDRSPVPERKGFFLLGQLVRLYVGTEVDFDVQLILKAADVPECQISKGIGLGPRLGWNTWVRTRPLGQDADEAIFEGTDRVWLN
jgi:type VI secretion system protein ImpH